MAPARPGKPVRRNIETNLIEMDLDDDDEEDPNIGEDMLLSPEEIKILGDRGFDTVVERLKVQLTAKTSRIEHLKDVIAQLESDVEKARKLIPKQDISKSVLLDKERSRWRIRKLQGEVTTLSSQVRYFKGENEKQQAEEHGNEQRIEHLQEELDKERDRVQKMSIELAACRRREAEHRNLLVEVKTLRAEKNRQEHERRSTAYILKVNKMQRAEHMRLFRREVPGLNDLSDTFPYGKRVRRKVTLARPSSAASEKRKISIARTVDGSSIESLREQQEKQARPELPCPLLLPRQIDSMSASKKSHATRPLALLIPKCGIEIKQVPVLITRRRSSVKFSREENPKLTVLLPGKVAKQLGQPELVSYDTVFNRQAGNRDQTIKLLLPRQSKQSQFQEEQNEELRPDVQPCDQPTRALIEKYERDELETKQEMKQLRMNLGMKMQTIKNMSTQLAKRDEEIKALQALAGSPLPRPSTPDPNDESDEEERDYNQHYIKQLQMDSSLKAQVVKNLTLQLQRRDEELKQFQSSEGVSMPRAFRDSSQSNNAQQVIKQLQVELGIKLDAIRNLNDQLDKRDHEISLLHRQLEVTNEKKKTWNVWENRCYEEPVKQTPASANSLDLRKRIVELEMDLRAARTEADKLRATADPEFLEEIERVRTENQELNQLCERYEKMLHSYCGQLGVPFKPLRSEGLR
ncbi:centrosomal protein of 83 kDa-like [Selaginella moellendorffii]|uniref:centrosomal protein of 83 kDa-like n=1 Tax=Selaginella moellendorffii TaxID=88036 RepID=UPI000D1CBD37|nr:centrosomal protein of 83 kDa-like [Selaginella moellendorffii]|eukprot:XP_024517787.1 centrosomal protein of 83 kDa-like [Selaginella moellendorffii]